MTEQANETGQTYDIPPELNGYREEIPSHFEPVFMYVSPTRLKEIATQGLISRDTFQLDMFSPESADRVRDMFNNSKPIVKIAQLEDKLGQPIELTTSLRASLTRPGKIEKEVHTGEVLLEIMVDPDRVLVIDAERRSDVETHVDIYGRTDRTVQEMAQEFWLKSSTLTEYTSNARVRKRFDLPQLLLPEAIRPGFIRIAPDNTPPIDPTEAKFS